METCYFAFTKEELELVQAILQHACCLNDADVEIKNNIRYRMQEMLLAKPKC